MIDNSPGTIIELYKMGRKKIFNRYYWQFEDWEDLLHEAIIKVKLLIDRGKVESFQHAIALLCLIAKQAFWRALKQRSNKISLNALIGEGKTATLEMFIADKNTLTEAETEIIEIVEKTISELPEIEKKIVVLSWENGETVSKIANTLGRTNHFVSQVIQKNRMKVAAKILGRKSSLGYY